MIVVYIRLHHPWYCRKPCQDELVVSGFAADIDRATSEQRWAELLGEYSVVAVYTVHDCSVPTLTSPLVLQETLSGRARCLGFTYLMLSVCGLRSMR
jgi:hypothetical protein